ncbi:unnamed protein product [Tuber melanosporum]|uniref:(Perigord truffle) hypothetical protein n=1 Tax=Tuber melanosporum (strain Mel28) TaxID=656061 RepID=D5GGI3_TUBMM|nr:uncharacterized protein GSTUM_00007400001 [Tuber melanosporum]CAZ83626.1 unnamed protein product [Tuber melanosporum]
MRGEHRESAPTIPQSGAEAQGGSSLRVVRKKGSLRSMFGSFLKSAKGRRANKTASQYPSRGGEAGAKNRGNEAPTLSAISLPTQARSSTSSTSSPYEDDGEFSNIVPYKEHGASCKTCSATSLPAQIRPPFAFHAPSSSSSSTSSIEFASDASTAATSPSVSSPSVLIKSPSSQSISALNHSTTSLSSTPSRETSPTRAQSSAKSSMMSKRALENHSKQPSPLSTVTDAHSPYILPTTPESPVLHERPNSFQPKRRGSLSNFILRRTQSHPDLTDFTTDDLPPFLQMPISAPTPRPGLSISSLSTRTLSLRRRSGKADIEAPTSYSTQEKIEHRSILGADPAGAGFYLYPTAQSEISGRRSSSGSSPGGSRSGSWGRAPMGGNMGDDSRRSSWTGPDGHNARGMPPAGRGWRDPRGGRSFGRSVTQQVILEEVGDVADSPQTTYSSSSVPSFDSQQAALRSGGLSNQNRSPDMTKNVSVPEKSERKRSPHNNWDSIQSQMQILKGDFPQLQVPPETRKGAEDCGMGEKMALRSLQQRAMRFMDASSADGNGSRGTPVTIEFEHPNRLSAVGNSRGLIDSLPIVRIESVEG